MPIKIQSDLPACATLEKENIFVMTEKRAMEQDIRPLKIAIVNLMPNKEVTETQLLRLLGNTPLQIEISLVNMENHSSKNTDQSYLDRFYIPSSELYNQKFDGMLITGTNAHSHLIRSEGADDKRHDRETISKRKLEKRILNLR